MTPDEICHFKVDVSRSLLLHLRPSLWDDEFRILFRSVYDAHGIQIENLYVVEVQIDSTVPKESHLAALFRSTY